MPMSRRYWASQQPKQYKKIKDSRIKWQPKRLSFEAGLKTLPFVAIGIYCVLISVLLILVVLALNILPPTIVVGQLFNLYTKEFPTILFLAMLYGVQMYLIYRDIVRRSMSRFLCVIPVMYFLLAINIIFHL